MCGPKNYVSKGKKSRTKSRHAEDLEYIPKPRQVVEGFGDIDAIDSNLEDEPVALAIEVHVLSSFDFGGEGVVVQVQCNPLLFGQPA